MAATLQERDAALREGERRFRRLIDSIPQLVWTCQSDGRCDFLGKQWVAYTGIPEAEQLGLGWLDQVHPEDRSAFTQAWEAAVAAGAFFHLEFRIKRADGVYRWFDTRAVPWADTQGRIAKWFGTNYRHHRTQAGRGGETAAYRAVANRGGRTSGGQRGTHGPDRGAGSPGGKLRQANEVLEQRVYERTAEVTAANERMKYLTSQIPTAQEQERKRISMDLHDDLGQSLLVLRMQLNAMLRKSPADLPIRPGLEESAKYLVEIIDKVRSLSHALSPSTSGNLSLTEAVRSLLDEFQKYHDIGTAADLDEVGPLLSKEARVGVYRILQNPCQRHRHAQATRVKWPSRPTVTG